MGGNSVQHTLRNLRASGVIKKDEMWSSMKCRKQGTDGFDGESRGIIHHWEVLPLVSCLVLSATARMIVKLMVGRGPSLICAARRNLQLRMLHVKCTVQTYQ
jgi:hypothetical protein